MNHFEYFHCKIFLILGRCWAKTNSKCVIQYTCWYILKQTGEVTNLHDRIKQYLRMLSLPYPTNIISILIKAGVVECERYGSYIALKIPTDVYGNWFNTLRPRQNVRHFADDIFKCIFLNKNVWISIEMSLKFVPKGPINNIPALVQIMAWCRPGDKPLSEPMMVSLTAHICVTRPQWVNDGGQQKE